MIPMRAARRVAGVGQLLLSSFVTRLVIAAAVFYRVATTAHAPCARDYMTT
jgi:uncharacterized membrane protein